MATKKPANARGRTTKKKVEPEIDKTAPWKFSHRDLANLNREAQKEFESKIGVRFLHAIDALENFGEVMEAKNFEGEAVDEYDMVTNLIAAYYTSKGAEFDFADDSEFGWGWADIGDLTSEGGDEKK